jgi:hypothetical protein
MVKEAGSMRTLRYIALAGLLATGCGPTLLQVRVMEPGEVNFGASRRLSIVETSGRRSAREQLITEIQSQARAGGHWQVTDRTEEGITVKVAGRSVNVTGAKTPQAPDEVFLKFDVIEWQSAPGTKTVQEKVSVTKRDSKGKAYQATETREKTVATIKGKALLGVTASDAGGRALLAETEYEGTGDGASDSVAVSAAAKTVVARFLTHVTPRVVLANIRIDSDDKAQKPIIEVAKAGNLPRAVEEMRAYLAQSPSNPVAQYNLAVFLDASGQYKEALDYYTQAAQNSTKPYYTHSKADCAKRLANVEALSN